MQISSDREGIYALSPEEQRFNDRLNTDYQFFARHCLLIKPKIGDMQPFIFNAAQQYIHKRLEAQLNATGKVRAIISKGRQQGCSTYIGGRYYHKATRNKGKSVFILSHQAETTEKLFQIVTRFHKNCPDSVRADTDTENKRRLIFAGLESEYFVGTAGNEEVGRGGTIQYLHASEAAFYPPNSGFQAGLMQSVPDAPGTEIIIESTSNGMDALFYKMAMDAVKGLGEFQVIFIPWFWQPEYRAALSNTFEMTPEEEKLADLYKLDKRQLQWRRNKLFSLGSEKKFNQEYPNNLEESFISSGNSLIKSTDIMAARKSDVKDNNAPLVIGVDPGRDGNDADRTVIAFRRGREMMKFITHKKMQEMQLAGILATLINEWNPVKVFIDMGTGYGTVGRLNELGFSGIVTGVLFGEGASNDQIYLNKRCEMWCDMRDWFAGGTVSCPDSDELHKDLACVPETKSTSSGLQKLESKDKIREDAGFSPDIGDAFALTFAYPVRRNLEGSAQGRIRKVEHKRESQLKSLAARRKTNNDTNVASATLPIFSGGQ